MLRPMPIFQFECEIDFLYRTFQGFLVRHYAVDFSIGVPLPISYAVPRFISNHQDF